MGCRKTLRDLARQGDIDGTAILKVVKSEGGIIEPGSGDHWKCRDSQGHFITPCPDREMGRGLGLKIIKTLIAAGFYVFLGMLVLLLASAILSVI
jgi:hypothetical protein